MNESRSTAARRIPLVDLSAHHEPIQAQLEASFRQVLSESSFIQGQHAKRFEDAFAAFVGARNCIAVGNGTDALFIALMALGIEPGDEVITAANSFIATSEAITRAGAKVVFVDCDPRTYTLDVDSVAKSITPRTRAVIPVHLYGQTADMDPLLELARQYNLFIVEDAAQAHGARYQGKMAGTLGDCACFSFYPGKNLGALGDAGAIVTSNDALAVKMRMFANHGRKGKYDHEFEGVNSRMDGIQALALSEKLKQLNAWNQRRREVAGLYDAAFQGICVVPFQRQPAEHVYHLYVIQVENRDDVRAALQERGIETGVHYPIPLPQLRAYRHLGYRPEQFPVADALKNRILSLPIHGAISQEDVSYVIKRVREVISIQGVSSIVARTMHAA